jgi:hypothetical protein
MIEPGLRVSLHETSPGIKVIRIRIWRSALIDFSLMNCLFILIGDLKES